MDRANSPTPKLSPYRSTLFSIGQELAGHEVENLLHLCKDSIVQREREMVKSAHDFFAALEKKGILAEGKLAYLAEVLNKIGRDDLIKILEHLSPVTSGPDDSIPGGLSSKEECCSSAAGPASNLLPTLAPRVAESHGGSKQSASGQGWSSLRSGGQGASDLSRHAKDGSMDWIETDNPHAPRAKVRDSGPAEKLTLQSAVQTAVEPLACHDQNSDESADGRTPGEDWRAADDDESEPLQLRDYQRELAQAALDDGGNYIICIPTGSGKTVTAAYICRRRYDEFQAESNAGRHFKALFVVPTRHLRQQQQRAFSVLFPSGQSVMTVEDQQTFEQALRADEPEPAVLMLTAQIFVNALKAKKASLRDLQMLILDECHHTNLRHPYNAIMKRYLRASAEGAGDSHQRPLPQVIGLSASLGVGQSGEALAHVLKLCANMDVRNVLRVRQHKRDLEQHVQTPEQDAIVLVSGRSATGRTFGTVLDRIMAQIQGKLGKADQMSLPRRGCQPYENEVMRRQEISTHEDFVSFMYLAAYNRALMLYEDLPVLHCLHTLRQFHDSRGDWLSPAGASPSREERCQQLFRDHLEEMDEMADQDADGENPKLKQLVELLEDQFKEKPDSKGIILTRMRIATVGLCEFIRASEVLKSLVRPERLVGQGPLEDFCISENAQRAVLDSFRQEDGCNVLVATDIAQEGLDMPACNFVIRYNFVSNEIGTVQSKGRARAEGSKCFLIVERHSINHKRELENRKKVEEMEKALSKLEAMEDDQRLEGIKAMQRKVLAGASEEEKRRRDKVRRNRAEVEGLACTECKSPLCRLEDLRRKGLGNKVTCVDPGFLDKVREEELSDPAERYRDTQSVCKIICNSSQNCRNKLGTKEDFFLDEETFGFSLTAKRFMFKLKSGGMKKVKQWIDVIPEDPMDGEDEEEEVEGRRS